MGFTNGHQDLTSLDVSGLTVELGTLDEAVAAIDGDTTWIRKQLKSGAGVRGLVEALPGPPRRFIGELEQYNGQRSAHPDPWDREAVRLDDDLQEKITSSDSELVLMSGLVRFRGGAIGGLYRGMQYGPPLPGVDSWPTSVWDSVEVLGGADTEHSDDFVVRLPLRFATCPTISVSIPKTHGIDVDYRIDIWGPHS